jgi:23S rRNA (pseudouridine1915-N3)-methyltransferase
LALRITIACVGRPTGWASEATDEYLRRVERSAEVLLKPVRAERDADADSKVAMQREARRLLEALPAGAVRVVLDPAGRALSSVQLAEMLRKQRDGGTRDLAFVIGGPVGLDTSVHEGAWLRLSLSPMTLPHELALVVLTEQLYRAFSILRGERYHKG